MKLSLIMLLLIVSQHHVVMPENIYDEVGTVPENSRFAVPLSCEPYCSRQTDKKSQDPVQSSIVDAMLRTTMISLNKSVSDIFSILTDQYTLPKGFKGPLAEYDFIVVGAGSAGSVVTSRLSEGNNASVLLLEAGQGENIFTDVPILAPLFQQTDYVWPYLMEHQPGICMGMKGERCFWPRGRAMGGTSVINYMIYTRGTPADWDRIAAEGNYGWSYKDVLPYYMKSERANLRGLRDSPWHGRDGELNVEDIPFRSKLSKAFLDATKMFGHRRVDYNSPDCFGFNFIQATMSRGVRVSSAKAFLHKIKKRKNLHILPSSRVTKILIDSVTKTAQGVEFYKNNRKYHIRVNKEIILSAGPIESPHLLMLSGIGPRKHLQSLGIQVIKDLNVGGTLYDHITFPALTFTLNTTRLTIAQRKISTVENVLQYTQYGDGPLSSLTGVETIGYIKTNVSDEVGDYPDIELLGTCASLVSDEGKVVARGLHIADWLYNDVFRPIENIESFTILLMLLHPESKGYMTLGSTNPFEQPKLYGNYLSHPKDVATVLAAIKYSIKLINTPYFRKYGAKLYKKPFPNCRKFEFGTDGYWECAVRTLTATLHHQISTCKMGPASDPNAVVDPELRVHGVNNLRVIDSSIIPRTLAAHTNAPAIMIGEKGADMIKKNYDF